MTHQGDPIAALADERLTGREKGLPARAAGLTVAEFLATEPRLDEFWTPLLVLDRAALDANAAAIQGWAGERRLELMPHGKTTMAPALWRLQLDAGASGLTLATPAQVRTARTFGVARIMLANALVDPAAIAWIAGELADPGFAFASWADAVDTVDRMEAALRASTPARPLDVLVELGGPGGRTGARDLETALRVARRIEASPVLRLAGVAGYEGSLGHDRSPASTAAVAAYLGELVALHDAVRELAGDRELIVTAGGSAYLDLVDAAFAPAIAAGRAAGRPTRWVLRSGASLVHDDGFYHGISPIDARLAPAMRGLARVVSHPEPGLALLDGGKRDFSYDEGPPVPFGVPGAAVTALNDQHAYLRSDQALQGLAVGDLVELGLSHPCTAFDKWRFIPVREHAASARVVDLVRTFF
ncbi:alanine racemase [Agromyces archimandritae]|uniref:Alanine racemase n=1 Tax=Agromyces archimandritae TaxID=2781962 RepID=A0A975IMU4_9MICO|nr:alanine racemase [Agromyces archimandritae]QTX03893.1 alanine racemase [Agromyces archimandritae]